MNLKHYISKCQLLFCIRLMALCGITVIVKKISLLLISDAYLIVAIVNLWKQRRS